MPFKLRNILDGRLLTSAGDLAVTCKGHLGEGGDHVLWQFLTETVLPPGTTLCPGCVVTSANQRYSLRYAASGALEIWDRSRKLREVELTRLEASSAGPGQVTLWPDGNLAQYDIHGRAIAISDTRRPNSVAVLTNDGWFQIVSPEGSILF